jgi:hypothetical protein
VKRIAVASKTAVTSLDINVPRTRGDVQSKCESRKHESTKTRRVTVWKQFKISHPHFFVYSYFRAFVFGILIFNYAPLSRIHKLSHTQMLVRLLPSGRCALLPYFSLTLFVSATLLFLVQPMIGKMILPQLGGTPAVWNTCMVFFQGVLLAGYGYTHFLTTTQPPRRQVIIHIVLLLLPFIVLPFTLGDWEPDTDTNSFVVFAMLLVQLIMMVGLPFLAVSTTAPLIQKWFGHTDHPAARDPYFLYGASNFGSMIGLAAYPFIIEQHLPVTPVEGQGFVSQVHFWTLGYAIFVALVVGCAAVVWKAIAARAAAQSAATAEPELASTAAVTAPAAATAIAASPRRRGARLDAGVANTDAPAKKLMVSDNTSGNEITLWRRLRWIGLAAAPTSLMLGVTTFMTTDIAPVTSFWILPLALYLLTFILVFARWPVVWTGTPHMVVMFVQPCIVLFLVLKMNVHDLSLSHPFLTYFMSPTAWEFVLHIAAFFATTLMCHGELAKDRPATRHLTGYFLWMSVGGVLGGLFNALFAPIVFQYGLWEYPLALVFACFLRSNMVDEDATLIPGDSTAKAPTALGNLLDFVFPVLVGVLCYVAVRYFAAHQVSVFLLQSKFLIAALVVGVLAMSLRPVRFGLGIAAIYFAVALFDRSTDPLVYEGRGFFGYMKVRDSELESYRLPRIEETDTQFSEQKVYRTLIHGVINHGRQIIDYVDNTGVENLELKLKKRREPITYFHERNGVAEIYHKLGWPYDKEQPPAAVVNITGMSDNRLPAAMFGLALGADAPFAMLANTQSEPPYAVLGLGTGILACYAKPYQTVDFYEIDPLVRDLSVPPGYIPPWHEDRLKNPKLVPPEPTFYFVQDAAERWANISVKIGDGRLVLKKEPMREKYYHIISLDAFSSDAIPVHLLTRDAVKVYLDKLADGGVLVFNTTNRYVRIEPVLSAIAKDLDLECLYCPDYTFEQDHPDRFSADWVALRRRTDEKDYKNGGPPLGFRLKSERKLLAWNGRPYTSKEGNTTETRWREVAPLRGPVWTDAYSNLFTIIRWR